MNTYTLTRVMRSSDGTFGILSQDKKPLCCTVENDWLDNQQRISCIPPGVYECEPFSGTKYKDVWILKDVPGRSYILIHAGNTHKHTEGCILVGKGFAELHGIPAVTNSRDTLQMLRKVMPQEFKLEIIEKFD
ncbi:MAG: hypothetical protein KDA17_07535 [Candidatus Saccharibacteria bacterium]|nr:hypothetical protein [Candidatus Saccharibacteria bacterium]